jgi:S-adenosylmethionine decarboxylase
MTFETRGKFYGVDVWFKNELPNIPEFLEKLADACKLHIVAETRKNFKPGETIVYILSESHLAVHTYPEHKYLSLDIYTCGDEGQPDNAGEFLEQHHHELGIEKISQYKMQRGMPRGSTPTNDVIYF